MAKKVLITGGAGFVGSHVADELLDAGYSVRVLDNLAPQVHGTRARRPSYLAREVEFIRGDVRDREAISRALEGIDSIFHFAAAVGVGQSMYEIANYTDNNSQGTAVLLESLSAQPIERLIVASSMSVYGEGLYRTRDGASVEGRERTLEQLRAHDWEVRASNGEPLIPVQTPETKCPALPSVYAISKYHQERLCLTIGRVQGKEEIEPEIVGKCRVGDIRNCFADISHAKNILGYKPRVSLKEGLVELAGWLKGQIAVDRIEHAARELNARGLAV